MKAKNRKKFKMKYYKVNHDANEVAFVLSGIGGDSKGKIARPLLKNWFKMELKLLLFRQFLPIHFQNLFQELDIRAIFLGMLKT